MLLCKLREKNGYRQRHSVCGAIGLDAKKIRGAPLQLPSQPEVLPFPHASPEQHAKQQLGEGELLHPSAVQHPQPVGDAGRQQALWWSPSPRRCTRRSCCSSVAPSSSMELGAAILALGGRILSLPWVLASHATPLGLRNRGVRGRNSCGL